MKERVRTIAAVIALVASTPTLMIAVGNWSGYWAIYALILMSFFGLPASGYLVASYGRARKARDTEQVSSGLIARSEAELARTKLRLVSGHRGRPQSRELIARIEAEFAAQNGLHIEGGRRAS